MSIKIESPIEEIHFDGPSGNRISWEESLLEPFWKEVDATELGACPDSDRATFYTKRTIVDVQFWFAMAKLERPEGFTYEVQGGKTGSEGATKTFNIWLPDTRENARLAVLGADRWLVEGHQLGGFKNGEGAMKSRYRKIQRNWAESQTDLFIFQQALVSEPDAPTIIDLELARSNPKIAELLAYRLHEKEDFGKWPRKDSIVFKERQKYYLSLMIAVVRYARDSVLMKLLETEVKKTREELHHWTGQMGKLDYSIAGVAVQGFIGKEDKTEAVVPDDGPRLARAEWAQPRLSEVKPQPTGLTGKKLTDFDRKDKAGWTSAALARNPKTTTFDMLRAVGSGKIVLMERDLRPPRTREEIYRKIRTDKQTRIVLEALGASNIDGPAQAA